MRRHWIDNLRWVTVLLVLLYHVIYFYNNKGVFGGVGGFGEFPEVPQYQDVLMYVGFTLKFYTGLPPVAMYLILAVAVFTLSPLTYEVLRRIPIIKWCIFGE